MEAETLAHQAIARLRHAGHQAYLVGGCVRDLLLGGKPKDFDVATDARPDRIMSLFPNSGCVGAHFGVVLVRDAFAQVEVATFRSDNDYTDGRRPDSVQFEHDARQDVLRRDFTINGLMMDPDTGTVLDYVEGRADLDRRVVRAIGDPALRFREDHLRLLRAVRFAARLGFAIDAETFAAMQRDHALVRSVAAERVRDELARILTEGGARRGFELLDESGLLEVILPEAAAMKGVEQPPQYHPEGDVWVHTLLLLEGMHHPTLTLALGALLHDIGKPNTFRMADRIRFDGHVEEGVRLAHQILTRLRFSNDEIAQVEALVDNHMKFKDLSHMRQSTLKRFLRMPNFLEHLELHRLDSMASNKRLDSYELARHKLDEFPDEHLKPAPLVTGADLIAAGYRPGPIFSTILTAVEDAQLEGRIHSAGEGLALVREMFPIAAPHD
ncbi:MAG TPA: CCA tRNA nucleotidyltransferase [Bryobacteraceae bacterium]|jgi:poly(A) polymerase|nr:CCA tRNA nucleotidyltransferase [Bryobacteraceae bacterium]